MEPYWEIGEVRLYEESRQLSRGPATVALRPQQHALVTFLVERHGEVVTKESLKQRLWGGHPEPDDHRLQSLVSEVRVLLERVGLDALKTISGTGYTWSVPARRIAPERRRTDEAGYRSIFPATRTIPPPDASKVEAGAISMSSPARPIKAAGVYIHPNGRFQREGVIWKEHRNDVPEKPFMFKELRRDDAYIYMYDQTRRLDPGRPMYLRLPIGGGVAQWTYPNPIQWEDLLIVEPQS